MRPEEGGKGRSPAKPLAEGLAQVGEGASMLAAPGNMGRTRWGGSRKEETAGHGGTLVSTTEEGDGWELVLELSCLGSSPSSASAVLFPPGAWVPSSAKWG